MRADADFMVYVAARWPYLVKEAVLLGAPPEDATEATTDALSRCRRDWGRASREDDVDALVRAELLLAVRRRPRTAEDGREQRARELLVLAPPTLEELRHQESVNNRATLRRAALIAVPLLLVGVGAGVYLGTTGDSDPSTPDERPLENAEVSREANPAPGIVWYADGQLHLDHTVLAVEGLRDMTRIGTGVVYGDDQGRVVFAADDGRREVLGHKDPEVPVAATDETGWAAWVETEGDRPRLVVKEAATGNEVASVAVDSGTRTVAVDGDAVYYVDSAGGHALLPGSPPAGSSVSPVSPGLILDVRSRTRAFQMDDDTIQVVQSYFSVEFTLPGKGAHLSPDGNVVATRLPGTDSRVAIYDTRSGEQFQDGLTDDDRALVFAPGDRGTITYVVAPGGLAQGRELQLRTCNLETTLCAIAARIPAPDATPVLAR